MRDNETVNFLVDAEDRVDRLIKDVYYLTEDAKAAGGNADSLTDANWRVRDILLAARDEIAKVRVLVENE